MGQNIETTTDDSNVAMIRLNRPEVRNALSPEVMEEIADRLEAFDADPEIHCVAIVGSEEVFAAGADIRALSERSFEEALRHPSAAFWRRLAAVKTPLVAGVSGYAFGGGCELALACDVIIASDSAIFALPEVTLGIIPGGGGTQRLTRAIGKQRAMEYVLTGRRFDADMALGFGLVNLVVPKKGAWLAETVEMARTIAARPPIATRLAKQAVLAAEESGLSAGLESERRLYELAMATEDRVEGMRAFLEKREPKFRGK